jgi:Gp49-like protein DUF891
MEIPWIDCATSQRMRAARPVTRCTKSRRVLIRTTGSQCQRSVPAYARLGSATALELYRVIYIATLADAVHVLHAFQKKSQKTAQRDLALAAARLRALK